VKWLRCAPHLKLNAANERGLMEAPICGFFAVKSSSLGNLQRTSAITACSFGLGLYAEEGQRPRGFHVAQFVCGS
jgi:hypothetical protein